MQLNKAQEGLQKNTDLNSVSNQQTVFQKETEKDDYEKIALASIEELS